MSFKFLKKPLLSKKDILSTHLQYTSPGKVFLHRPTRKNYWATE